MVTSLAVQMAVSMVDLWAGYLVVWLDPGLDVCLDFSREQK